MKKTRKKEEFRMKADEFDDLMRNALGSPPFPTRKKTAKKTRTKARSKK